ncbi:MAG TPA: Gfo/Idh/MocA family oxidoreductase [Clostridia bacterium]|jgi:predicted dehydrogenase|nr:MAG: Inositol 2-dehydrogenase [Firmicutes bacterium ADurb.Bin146]HOD93697.1 Gfo/Idh/MocA family oxidoreductase [Clostridia bacterium]HQM38866.1 Gfo/Idh/MocA family oxidoreductase [Clostridia bacterium]
MKKVRVGLYGINGHQIHNQMVNHDKAYVTAISMIDKDKLPKELINEEVIFYEDFDSLINAENVDVVSICAPKRIDQKNLAIKAMLSGKHVYSEKPCAYTESDLDEILEVSRKTGKLFHEMAGSVFDEPFISVTEIIKSGRIGEVVQVFAQKSYPYKTSAGRPQDDITDGGLIRWIAIHAARFVEHTTGLKMKEIYAMETKHGNPVKDGNLKMAASMMFSLENNAVGCIVSNYLNMNNFPTWGNEHLRVWGTNGFVEITDGLTKTRLVTPDYDGPVEIKHKSIDYFDFFIDEILYKKPMPLTLEEELHPLRMVIRAQKSAVEVE